MGLIINGVPTTNPAALNRKKSGHTEPQCPTFSLAEPGHKVRVAHFQWFMDCRSHSAFCVQRRKGRVLPPDGYDKNRPYWWSQNVKTFLDGLRRTRWERTGKRTH